MTNPLNFSKSKYCGLWQCPKIAWLRKYKPEAWMPDDALAERMRVGDEIGDLAMGLFGPYVEVTARDGDRLDLCGQGDGSFVSSCDSLHDGFAGDWNDTPHGI